MRPLPPLVPTDEERLGMLAFNFRGTRREDEPRRIADEYAETVKRLVGNGHRDEAPPPEDQLPDDYMPKEFFDHWLGPKP